MKTLLSLALALILAAPTAFAGELENGSTSIFHVIYASDFEDEHTGCKTLIVVTTEKEILRLSAEIRAADGPYTVYLKDPAASLRLHPVDRDHLVGRVKGTGRRVIVMTKRYADRHGWY